MKESVLDTLRNGGLSEKKLKKSLWKVCKEQYDDEEEFESKLQSTLKSLLKKDKIKLEDDEYVLTDSNKVTKRKRDETEEDEEVKSEKIIKTAKADKPITKGKVLKYEELWKTGEQHWRDNSFDQEYLRTNPEKYELLCNYFKTTTQLFHCDFSELPVCFVAI